MVPITITALVICSGRDWHQLLEINVRVGYCCAMPCICTYSLVGLSPRRLNDERGICRYSLTVLTRKQRLLEGRKWSKLRCLQAPFMEKGYRKIKISTMGTSGSYKSGYFPFEIWHPIFLQATSSKRHEEHHCSSCLLTLSIH